MRIMIVAVMALAVCVPASAKEFGKTYDRFKDRTSYSYATELASGMPIITWGLDIATAGQKSFGKDDQAKLSMVVTYDMSTSKALDCALGVQALVDGKPFAIDTALPTMFFGKHGIATYGRKLKYAEVQALAQSKSVEFRICGNEYQFSTDQLAEVGQFLTYASQSEL